MTCLNFVRVLFHRLTGFLGRGSTLARVACVGLAITLGTADFALGETRLHVDGTVSSAYPTGTPPGLTWADAFKYFKDAIDYVAAQEPVETNQFHIWVRGLDANGGFITYYPDRDHNNEIGTGSRFEFFGMQKWVRWYGGFKGTETSLPQRHTLAYHTILSGAINTSAATDNSYHVVMAFSPIGVTDPEIEDAIDNAINDTARMDGFVIKNGYADGLGTYGGMISHGVGGGLAVWAAQPIIQNCVFIDNHAGNGGGAHVEGRLPFSPGGIPSHPQFIDCAFINNTADDDGGALGNRNDQTTIVNSVFIKNDAGDNGGGVFQWSPTNVNLPGPFQVTIKNSTFTENTATTGGAIYNRPTGAGFTPVLNLYNSILWDDSATTDAELHNEGTLNASNNDIEGNSGTLNQDPLFADVIGLDDVLGTIDDNVRLQSTTPCRNQGSNTYLVADTYDADDDGNTSENTPDKDRLMRVVSTTVDMGAYEHHSSAPSTCCEDINGSGCVNIDDLLAVINGWARPGIADIAATPGCAGNGTVNIDDLLWVISAWGPCDGFNCSETSMPQSVEDCMDDASEEYEAYTQEWNEFVNACVDALCRAQIIDCD